MWRKFDATHSVFGWMELGEMDAYFYGMHTHDSHTHMMPICLAIFSPFVYAMRWRVSNSHTHLVKWICVSRFVLRSVIDLGQGDAGYH